MVWSFPMVPEGTFVDAVVGIVDSVSIAPLWDLARDEKMKIFK